MQPAGAAVAAASDGAAPVETHRQQAAMPQQPAVSGGRRRTPRWVRSPWRGRRCRGGCGGRRGWRRREQLRRPRSRRRRARDVARQRAPGRPAGAAPAGAAQRAAAAAVREQPRRRCRSNEMEREDFADAGPDKLPLGRRAVGGLPVEGSRRRSIEEGGFGARRNVRRPVHRTSAARNAHRDGLLAERQAVHPRLDAEHVQTVARCRRAGVGIDAEADVVLISEYTGGGFGSKIPGAIIMAIPALLSKKANAPVMMRITREEEHYIGRARPGIHAASRSASARTASITAHRHVRDLRQRPVQRAGRRPLGRHARVAAAISRRRCGGAV